MGLGAVRVLLLSPQGGCRCWLGEVLGAMGRLDDHAKRRIVELCRAGLSFHKIKKVLELDDIYVMPQAVYLFLKQKSVERVLVSAAWDTDEPQPPLQGQETKLPKLAGPFSPAVPGGDPLVSQGPAAGPDTKEGTQSVSPASLCQGGGQSSEAFPMGLPPGNGDGSSTGALLAPGIMASTHQPLPSQEWPSAPLARNPALMVKKQLVDRTIILQKQMTALTRSC
ncbi:uncharacterized protein LOC133210936 [Neopsephotus bourkii]|uniref:uncharacterized protein LOC133210936 n=1 Tax=Neopsephotus bourkii TaxID=309878 RepID=UPI002AA549D3|nr:uncharacterized protein LOC133210936 [Neopsephotus bourkii]